MKSTRIIGMATSKELVPYDVSSGVKDNSMLNEGACIARCDVFVLFDDRDGKTRSTILPELSNNNIVYSTIDDGIPGNTSFDNVEMLLENSNKSLIIVSSHFLKNEHIKLLAKCVIEYHSDSRYNKTITLMVDDNLKAKGMLFLKSTKTLHFSSPTWRNELVTEIRVTVPDFCEVVSTGKFTDALSVMGLCPCHTTYDLGNVYGLVLRVKEKLLTIDLQEYSDHLQLHQHLNTASICGQCNTLCNIDTKVSLVFDKKFTSKNFHVDVPNVLVDLFLNVFDIETSVKKNMNQLVSGILKNSSIGVNQLPYLSLLFGKVRRAIMNKWISLSSQPIFPNFKNKTKRLESFANMNTDMSKLSMESLVDAGFFYNEETELVECFSCSIATVHFRGKGSPFQLHLEAAPECKYINSITPPPSEKLFVASPSEVSHIVEEFRDFEQRKLSYESFDVSNVTTICEFVDKETIVDKLCEAGFYYSGRLTLVNCFCCRIAIFFNKDDVDPWVLHASLSPLCPYVLDQKGEEFVKTFSSIKRVGHDEDDEHFVITFSLKSLDSHDPYRTKGYNFTLYHI